MSCGYDIVFSIWKHIAIFNQWRIPMTVLKGSVHKNRDGDTFKVIGIKSENDVKIVFPETGYRSRVRSKLLLDGYVQDYTEYEVERTSWLAYSETFTTNAGQPVEAISRKGNKVRVRFSATGYITVVNIANARSGSMKDPYAPLVYGHGSVGVPDKTLPYCDQAKQLWQNMLKRCYCEKDERGYFGKSVVDDRWLCFENFLVDIKTLEGFDMWVKGHTDSYYNSNLDKDYYVPDNVVYSRNYCRFLPQAYNKSLGKKNKTEKDWA